jgi:hypothetical protein
LPLICEDGVVENPGGKVNGYGEGSPPDKGVAGEEDDEAGAILCVDRISH